MTDVDWSALQRAGLYDPDASDAEQVRSLLHWLIELGWGVDEILAATDTCELASLAAEGPLRPPPEYTLAQAAAEMNVEPGEFDHLRRTAGLARRGRELAEFSKADVEAFRGLEDSSSMFSERESHHLLRVLGSSLARIADAAVSLFLIDVEGPMRAAGATEFDVAKVNLEANRALDGIAASLDPLLRLHLEDAVARSRASRDDHDDPHIVRMAVGFVDLVGFTPFSGSLAASELGRLVRDFEDAAYDVVSDNGGRVVKTIGDEVMFIAVDAEEACACATSLLGAFEGRRITPRGGLAYGELLARGGDYYGPVVNLASRIGDLAVPSEVLATPEVAERSPSFLFEPAGRRQLKGFEEPVSLVSLSV